jgi:serine/threonine-protein kinase/endoribonuclease IRE1
MHPGEQPLNRGAFQQPPPPQQQQQGTPQATAFPARPGQPLCDFYSKTGHCKYGEACKFDHPQQYAVQLNSLGLPIRPAEPVCSFYEKTRVCKFGPACKFNHPELPAGS